MSKKTQIPKPGNKTFAYRGFGGDEDWWVLTDKETATEECLEYDGYIYEMQPVACFRVEQKFLITERGPAAAGIR